MKKSIKCFHFCFIWASVFLIFAAPSVAWTSCSVEEVVLHYQYLGACGYTQSTSFTLAEKTTITRIGIWYDTNFGGDSLSVTLTGNNGYLTASGTTTKGASQWSWCEGVWNIDQTLQAGTYTLRSDSQSICANPSGLTTLTIYGCIPDDPADNQSDGINPPEGLSVVDATSNHGSAPVYMGNLVTTGNLPALRGKMELSVDFPAYNRPVDIWILIGLPDGRFYVADESGKLLNLDTSSFSTIASGVAGSKTTKTILPPFETGSAVTATVITPFDPWPDDGVWTVYWLVAPQSNGDIFEAISNNSYELGFYLFEVNSNSDSNIPDTGTALDIAATLDEEFLAVRDTSIISEADENELAQAVIKANEADLQTKMLFNSFYMASANTPVKTMLNTYRAMAESFRITTEHYDDIILTHELIETTARKRGGQKLFSKYGQELNVNSKLQWYLDNYGKSTPSGNRIDIKAIAERNKISTEKAFILLKTQYGVIAELATASAIQYEAGEKSAQEIKVASDRANTVLSFATGGQALLGAFKAAKTLNSTLTMYEAGTLGYNTAEYIVKTQTKNLVQGAVNGGFQIGDGVFGILTDPSVESNFSPDFQENLNMAKSLWSGINIAKCLTFDAFCLLSVKDAFTGNSKLIISDLTDFTKTTLDTTGHIISILQDETGGFIQLFQQPESFAAESLKKDLVYTRLSPDNMLPNGDYIATDENGIESSFQVTGSNAQGMLQNLPEDDILIDINGNIEDVEPWDDEDPQDDGQVINLTDQQKTDFLNCACRCSSGWAGHIGVWYDPNPASATENGGTGPCIGGAGSFGGTSRHQLIVNDCTKSCWSDSAGTYNSSAVEQFLKQENDNFTNTAK